MTGAALFQPPKSSSALIFGGPVTPNPPLPPRPLFVDMELPQPNSGFAADLEGEDLILDALEAAGASDVAHASLEAHGSTVEKDDRPDVLPWLVCVAIDAGWEGGAGAERLNAEFMLDGGEVMLLVEGAGVDSEKSNRSFRPEVVVDFGARDPVPGAELKSPKPLEELTVRCTCCAGGLG